MNILYMIGNGFDIHIGLVYLAITYLGSVYCFCGLKILILNGSGLQIQTNGTTRTSAGSVQRHDTNIRGVGPAARHGTSAGSGFLKDITPRRTSLQSLKIKEL